jgi:glutamate synthase (NADPH) small chain
MRDLFSKFVEMEKQHMATPSARYHIDPPAPGDLHLERAAVYAGIPNRSDAPDNLFQIAIAFEERAAQFFARHHAECSAGSAEWQIYKELAAEEREHVAVLLTELERWREGKPGLL